MTSLQQSLDVCLSKPFKDNVRGMDAPWKKIFHKGRSYACCFTRCFVSVCDKGMGRRRKECVINSIEKCGISNAMDDTEDELICESEDRMKPKLIHPILTGTHITMKL